MIGTASATTVLLPFTGQVYLVQPTVPTGAVPAMKPEATAIELQDGRWKITLMFDGRRFCILKFLGLLRYSRRHVIGDRRPRPASA